MHPAAGIAKDGKDGGALMLWQVTAMLEITRLQGNSMTSRGRVAVTFCPPFGGQGPDQSVICAAQVLIHRLDLGSPQLRALSGNSPIVGRDGDTFETRVRGRRPG